MRNVFPLGRHAEYLSEGAGQALAKEFSQKGMVMLHSGMACRI